MYVSEYVQLFQRNGRTLDALIEIVKMLIEEVVVLKSEQPQTLESSFVILDSIDLRFGCIVLEVGGRFQDGTTIDPSMFRRIYEHNFREEFESWDKYRKGIVALPE